MEKRAKGPGSWGSTVGRHSNRSRLGFGLALTYLPQSARAKGYLQLPRYPHSLTYASSPKVSLHHTHTSYQFEMSPLTAFNPPLGPILSHYRPEEVTLHMKEKAFSFSGDDFAIKTTYGLSLIVFHERLP